MKNSAERLLERDWNGKTVEPGLEVKVSLTETELRFGGERKFPPTNVFESRPFQFYEGLWEADCLELFIGQLNGERYLEVNLAPNGSWAIFVFSSYRQLEETVSEISPKIETDLREEFWSSYISLSIDFISDKLLGSSAQGRADIGKHSSYNVSATIKNHQEILYLTWVEPVATKPDFHSKDLRILRF